LLPPVEWHPLAQSKVQLGTFDVLLTNPPFGAKISIKGATVLSQYELGFKWGRDKATREPAHTTQLEDKRSPQILFLERCLQLLKTGGRMGIVLPESILGNPSYEYLVSFLQRHTIIRGVVTMPEPLFKTSGKGGTHTKVAVLFLEKKAGEKSDYDIFMSDVKWCGHDSRGNPTLRKDPDTGKMALLDEVPLVPKRYREVVRNAKKRDHLGFLLSSDQIKHRIFVPKYYDPEIEAELVGLKRTHELVRLGDLQVNRSISVDTGLEIGKMAYGTGKIPFIRTSDLSNWEIKADFKHGVSQEIYDEIRHKIDVKNGDILLVRDGTYLIGTSAIVTEADLPMLFQSHIYRVRVLKPSTISPWLLFACLNTPIVKRQIRAKQFTQDIIDTLGRRFTEILLPVPKDATVAAKIARETQEIIESRAILRNRAKAIALELQGQSTVTEEDLEAIAEI
jgi:type I restriction enzyme M protein